MDPPTIRRQLKIKVGSIKRLRKEQNLYEMEVKELETKLSTFKARGAEEWDVKNATRMLEESSKMIKDTSARLNGVVEELQGLVKSSSTRADMNGDEELIKAKQVLEEA
ncbi:hypothetical protein APHAL10511_005945 [Amanita phalloides]|nr:hypothetical protein APHAL10511_005945 [Amanita phalloides]